MSNKLICPNCGSEFELPEESHFAAGMCLARNGGNATITMPLAVAHNNNVEKKENRNMENVMNQSNAGVKYFNMYAPDGRVIKCHYGEDGTPVVDGYEEEVKATVQTENIYDPRIGKRWVMAHTFKMLAYNNNRLNESGWHAALRRKGYKYQWDVIADKVKELHSASTEEAEILSHFYNKDMVLETANDFLEKLKKYVNGRTVKNCKGIPYITISHSDHAGGWNVFVEDLNKKVYGNIKYYISRILYSSNGSYLYNVLAFINEAKKYRIPGGTKHSRSFINAYIGYGSYFTLMNMTMYHGCRVEGMNEKESVDTVNRKLVEYDGQYWRLQAFLKKVIADNEFKFQ